MIARSNLRILWIAALVLALAVVPAVAQPPAPATAESVHLALGNPSGATPDVAAFDNYLMVRPQYALAYSRTRGTPKWVSWHLQDTDLGSAPRTDAWRIDRSLPQGWFRVSYGRYGGTGFNAGHMCPSEDRTATIEDNEATFVLTNIVPQTPELNQGPWAMLEEYSRDLVRSGNELYITSGGYGQRTTFADGRVTVPTATWKVIVVMPKGENDVTRVKSSTRVIAVDMPNSGDIRQADWRRYRVSVRRVESASSFDFLSKLSRRLQNTLERRVDAVSD